MPISEKLADSELSKSKKNEEGEKKITTALGQLQRQGLTLIADVVHQVREQAQRQGLYNADSIKQLAKEHLNKTDETPKLPEIMAQDKPTSLSQDAAEKEKRTKDTNAGMHAFEIKEEEKDENLPKDKEKAERLMKLRALVYAMRDEDGLGIKRARYGDSDKPVKPKTAEEAYLAKEGDCDDLSRLYVALAQEQLGITNMSQFYVVFKNERTREEQGHAALFYVDGAVLYIDPGFEKAHIIPTKSNSLEEAIKDPEFRKNLEQYQFEARGKTDRWKISEIKAIPGPQSVEAVYCFEMGNYFAKTDDWAKTEKYMQAAIEGGVNDFEAYFRYAEASYFLGKHEEAISRFTDALALKQDSDCYHYRGRSYFKLNNNEKLTRDEKISNYEKARSDFVAQLKFNNHDLQAKYDLAVTCYNLGIELQDAGRSKEAFQYYTEAEKSLTEIIASSENEFIKDANNLLKDVKNGLNETKTK